MKNERSVSLARQCSHFEGVELQLARLACLLAGQSDAHRLAGKQAGRHNQAGRELAPIQPSSQNRADCMDSRRQKGMYPSRNAKSDLSKFPLNLTTDFSR